MSEKDISGSWANKIWAKKVFVYTEFQCNPCWCDLKEGQCPHRTLNIQSALRYQTRRPVYFRSISGVWRNSLTMTKTNFKSRLIMEIKKMTAKQENKSKTSLRSSWKCFAWEILWPGFQKRNHWMSQKSHMRSNEVKIWPSNRGLVKPVPLTRINIWVKWMLLCIHQRYFLNKIFEFLQFSISEIRQLKWNWYLTNENRCIFEKWKVFALITMNISGFVWDCIHFVPRL